MTLQKKGYTAAASCNLAWRELTSPTQPSNIWLIFAGFGRSSMLGTPPRNIEVWILRPWALPGEVVLSTGPWSTLRWPSRLIRSATTVCHWPKETGCGLRRMAWPENQDGRANLDDNPFGWVLSNKCCYFQALINFNSTDGRRFFQQYNRQHNKQTYQVIKIKI